MDGQKMYSFLSAGWGILADIDVESEVLRSLGEPRFSLWSVIRIMNLRSYKAELSFVPIDESTSEVGGPENSPPSTRTVVDAEFISIYSSCQMYIGTDLAFAPEAIPNDGVIHLTYMTKDVGRSTTVQYLVGLGNGT